MVPGISLLLKLSPALNRDCWSLSWGLLPLLTYSPDVASEHATLDTCTLFSGLSKAGREGNSVQTML